MVSILVGSPPGRVPGGEWSHETSASVWRWLGAFDLYALSFYATEGTLMRGEKERELRSSALYDSKQPSSIKSRHDAEVAGGLTFLP